MVFLHDIGSCRPCGHWWTATSSFFPGQFPGKLLSQTMNLFPKAAQNLEHFIFPTADFNKKKSNSWRKCGGFLIYCMQENKSENDSLFFPAGGWIINFGPDVHQVKL
jgi:hypothetical protein